MWRARVVSAVCLAVLILGGAAGWAAAEQIVEVADDAALRAAVRGAQPGTRIRIAPGRYKPGLWVEDLHGTAARPIVIEGADPDDPPRFEGGSQAWHLSNCSHVTLRHIDVRGPSRNGINVDDGGTFDDATLTSGTHHVVLEHIRVYDVGPKGNHDGIKLSGITDFVVRHSRVEGWGGEAVDMVGCHRGLIERCVFLGKEGFDSANGVKTKGGSSRITIRRCLFRNVKSRAVNVGGSTGLAHYRPQNAGYEAKDIVVEGCAFVGGDAAVAFAGIDGAVFRYNTIYRPQRWILRILQEMSDFDRFVRCRNGRFEHNLVVFRKAELSRWEWINIGRETEPESFVFANNLWYCEDAPEDSEPELPSQETGGVYGVDPQLTDPARNRFRPREPRAAAFGALAFPE